jgi:hypothetical protein
MKKAAFGIRLGIDTYPEINRRADTVRDREIGTGRQQRKGEIYK